MKRLIVLLPFLVLSCGVSLLGQEEPVHGFSPLSWTRQKELEDSLKSLPEAEKIRRTHRILTEDPHVAGTPGGKKVADYIFSQLRDLGISTRLVEYDVLLSYPKTVELELLVPEQLKLANPEVGYPEDKDTFDTRVDPPWNAYAASGEVSGEVVYANYGSPEDYDELEKLGVTVRDRIVIVRYFGGYRGGKSLEAENRGVKALIIYSDPADDGYVQGETYPKGPWGPESHFQRGASVYDFRVPGDPLTPGWASTRDARRIPEEESTVLPKIPTLPISYADATPILKHLAGSVVPPGWQGGLPFTYHVGPGPSAVHLKLEITREIRTIYNVVGTIKGWEEPEKQVILSNHHDAWVYGGVDPSSGTAALLELGRILAGLIEQGWRPRRTIVLGCWDAEEYTLTGSTEWGEENAQDLQKNAVACLNVDAASSGSMFTASAVPSLRRFIVEATGSVKDPRTGRSILQEWQSGDQQANIRGYSVSVESQFPVDIGILGSGSDYTVFFNFLGVPSVDMIFDGPYGVYHSQYDNHRWVAEFGDPGFLYHRAMVSLWGIMATRLANADILPFDYEEYARDLRLYVKSLPRERVGDVSFDDLLKRISALEKTAAQVNGKLERMLNVEVPSDLAKPVNRALLQVERDFTQKEGLPGRPWFKHLLYAPLPSYEAETLPAVREALVRGNRVGALEQLEILEEAIARATETLAGIQ